MSIPSRFAAVLAAVAVVTGLTATGASAQTVNTWCTGHANIGVVGTSAETGYATTGYNNPDGTFQPTVYGWVTRFSNSVHAQWGTNVHDYAHNGALASDYLPGGRWTITTGAGADMATYQPDLVLVDVGGNELNAQVTPATFQTNLTTLITNIKATRPGVTILMSIYAKMKWVPNQYTNPPYESQQYTWDQYAQIIYNTAVTQQTALVDMRQYVPDAESATLPNPNVWSSDNIHVNDAGNLAEYGAWWGWVSSLASIC